MEASFISPIALILSIIFIVGAILLTRLLGSWMLRINEVIRLLTDIKGELKKNTTTHE